MAAGAMVVVLPAGLSGCPKQAAAPPSGDFYVQFTQAALHGKVHRLPPGQTGHGWIGDHPPGPDTGWKPLGTVPKGPWEGDTVWKRR